MRCEQSQHWEFYLFCFSRRWDLKKLCVCVFVVFSIFHDKQKSVPFCLSNSKYHTRILLRSASYGQNSVYIKLYISQMRYDF